MEKPHRKQFKPQMTITLVSNQFFKSIFTVPITRKKRATKRKRTMTDIITRWKLLCAMVSCSMHDILFLVEYAIHSFPHKVRSAKLANVIRYFLCRALQLPPEAWLRYCPFNCSLTYFTIRPTGTVSCRMVGDIGHLPYEMSTFSQHAGFLW